MSGHAPWPLRSPTAEYSSLGKILTLRCTVLARGLSLPEATWSSETGTRIIQLHCSNNGMVLIAGAADFGVIGSAELYNPAAGRFTATGYLNKPRAAHTSTLLPDGTVLVTGGWGPSSTTFANAELYDASSGTFSATGQMVAARFGHTATLLPNGTVLLAGGAYGANYDPLVIASAELYHPASLVPAPALLSIWGDQQGAILHAGTARVVGSGRSRRSWRGSRNLCHGTERRKCHSSASRDRGAFG